MPIVIFLLFLKEQKSKELWVIFLFTIYSFLNDCGLYFLKGQETAVQLLNLFTIVELGTFSYFFYIIFRFKYKKAILAIISGIFILFSSIYLYSFPAGEVSNIQSLPVTIEAFILITYALYYFYEQIERPQSFFIYQSPNFWIVLAILLYFTGTFFFFIYAESFNQEEVVAYSALNYAINATKNILFAIGFLIKSNHSNKSDNRFEFPKDIFRNDKKFL